MNIYSNSKLALDKLNMGNPEVFSQTLALCLHCICFHFGILTNRSSEWEETDPPPSWTRLYVLGTLLHTYTVVSDEASTANIILLVFPTTFFCHGGGK